MLTWIIFLIIIKCNSNMGTYISNSSYPSEDIFLNEDAFSFIDAGLEQPKCNDDKFLHVLVHFRIANPEDLFLLAMRGNDDPNLCRDLTVGTDKITQYLRHCTLIPEQDLYVKLLSGLAVVKQKLCEDKDFMAFFKENEDCYNAIQFETESCFGPNDWLETTNSSELCSTMKDVLGCYYTKTLVNCDLIAAELLNDLMKSVMNSITDENCPNLVQGNYIRNLRSLSTSCGLKIIPSNTVPAIISLLLLLGLEGELF